MGSESPKHAEVCLHLVLWCPVVTIVVGVMYGQVFGYIHLFGIVHCAQAWACLSTGSLSGCCFTDSQRACARGGGGGRIADGESVAPTEKVPDNRSPDQLSLREECRGSERTGSEVARVGGVGGNADDSQPSPPLSVPRAPIPTARPRSGC